MLQHAGKVPVMGEVHLRMAFAKFDAPRRLVTAWASVVSNAPGDPVIDSQGDIIPIESLEDAFIEAFADGGLRKGGEMHDHIGGADVVQQFTLSHAERIALGFGEGPAGAIVKFRINDDELLKRVTSGELSEVSIAGDGFRTPADG